MNFIRKSWIITTCSLILIFCFLLISNGFSSPNYPNGSFGTLLSVSIIFLTKLFVNKTNETCSNKYIKTLNSIFLYTAVPALVFTSFGIFQKQQINNAKKEMRSIIENGMNDQKTEKKHYNQIAYGELTPILQMINDGILAQEEKEKEYLSGLDEIFEMIHDKNICNKATRTENKLKLTKVLEGTEKYKAWLHSEMALRERKLKKLNCNASTLNSFRKSAKENLSLNDELMESYSELIILINDIISFAEENHKKFKLVNDEIKWDDNNLARDFAILSLYLLNPAEKIEAIAEKQIAYQQKLLEKADQI